MADSSSAALPVARIDARALARRAPRVRPLRILTDPLTVRRSAAVLPAVNAAALSVQCRCRGCFRRRLALDAGRLVAAALPPCRVAEPRHEGSVAFAKRLHVAATAFARSLWGC